MAPLVAEGFELYGSEEWGLNNLSETFVNRGVRNKEGRKAALNELSTTFHNPFYTGLFRIRKSPIDGCLRAHYF